MSTGKAPGLVLPSVEDAISYLTERRAQADDELRRHPGDLKAQGQVAAYADAIFLMRGEHRNGTVLEVLISGLARRRGYGNEWRRWKASVRR